MCTPPREPTYVKRARETFRLQGRLLRHLCYLRTELLSLRRIAGHSVLSLSVFTKRVTLVDNHTTGLKFCSAANAFF
jgi:hypothetical protein